MVCCQQIQRKHINFCIRNCTLPACVFHRLGPDGKLQVGNTGVPGYRDLIHDVRDAVSDLVEIITTYQSKGRLSQVMMSTMFKRRQNEAEAVVEAAISRLQVRVNVKLNYSDVIVGGN